eukprot:SAG11_NODE_18734_length_482_cov_4.647520_1_plen_79_part_00
MFFKKKDIYFEKDIYFFGQFYQILGIVQGTKFSTGTSYFLYQKYSITELLPVYILKTDTVMVPGSYGTWYLVPRTFET